MVKFDVLKYDHWIMTRLGIHSYRVTDPTNEFLKSIGSCYMMFTLFFINLMLSSTYVYIHWPNFEMIFEALLIVCANMQTNGMFLNTGLQMKKIKVLQLKLQEIVDEEDLEDEIQSNYWKAELMCRKYTKTIFSYFYFHITLPISSLLYSFYCINVGQYDTTKWILPFVIHAPFDTTSFLGWYILWFIQLNVAITYIWVILSITSYFVSCSVYICAICDHFNLLFDSLKEYVDQSQGRKKKEPYENSLEYRNKIKNAVDVHGKVYEIFNIVANINSGTIFSLLPWNALFLALTMYNTEHSPFDPVMLIWHAVCIACGLFWPFLFCLYATFAIRRIHDIGEFTYASDWYNYPLNLQKNMILIIARSQERVEFNGLNLFYCNMEVFGKIIKASCSYYCIFRSLTE